MIGRASLVLAAAVPAFAWAVCGLVYATNGDGGYNHRLFALLILVAAGLTVAVGFTAAKAWQTHGRVLGVAVAVLSVLATASILVLAMAINLRG